jgi:hypothetical protein
MRCQVDFARVASAHARGASVRRRELDSWPMAPKAQSPLLVSKPATLG